MKSIGIVTSYLYASAYRTLSTLSTDKTAWIDEDIIDCCAIANIKHWKGVMYVPTLLIYSIIRDISDQNIHKDSQIYKLRFPTKGRIFMPYVYRNHWRLMVVNIHNQTIIVIDPERKHACADQNRAFAAFRNYIQSEKHTFESILKSMKWKLQTPPVDRPLQIDSHNCGIFIIDYSDCLGEEEPFDLKFVPQNYRREIADALLMKSEDLKETCQYCVNTQPNLTMVMCNLCRRWVHASCLKNKFKDTSDYTKQSTLYSCNPCKEACKHEPRDWMIRR